MSGVAFSPDGKRLATTTANEVVRLWEFAGAPGVILRTRSPSGRGLQSRRDARAHRDRFHRAGWGCHRHCREGRIRVDARRADLPCDLQPRRRLRADCQRGSPRPFVGRQDRQRGRRAAASRRVHYAAFSRDGKMLLTASEQLLVVWDVAALPQVPSEPKVSLTHDGELVLYGEFSADGREILSVDFGGTARVWNVETAQERTELRRSEITLARLSRDGRRMATAGEDRVLRIWDTATGAPVGQPVPHEYRMTAVAFSPDGRRVVTANEGSVRIWDTESGSAVTPPMQHDDRVMHAVFSADGTRVLTASTDRTARVWNAASGQPVTDPLEHRWMVRYAEFSPDGQQGGHRIRRPHGAPLESVAGQHRR